MDSNDERIRLDLIQLYQTRDAFLLWDGVSRTRFHKQKAGRWIPKSVCKKIKKDRFSMPVSWAKRLEFLKEE